MTARGHRRTSDVGTAAGGTDRSDLIVGLIRAPHGARGEVRVEAQTDVGDRFAVGAVLECDAVGHLRVARVRGTASEPILSFEGYATRGAAEPLRGRYLRVPREESRRATAGAYLWADLVGLRAETPEGASLGTVRDVLRPGSVDVLVVRRDDSAKELLLPALASVIRQVDLGRGRIVVVPQEYVE